jgi:hypothetical protein
LQNEFAEIRERMDEPPFLIPVFLNSSGFVNAQVDSGCQSYGAISERACQRLGIEQVSLPTPRVLGVAVKGVQITKKITRIAHVTMDIDGWISAATFYVVPGLAHDVILGLPWMNHRGITLDPANGVLTVNSQEGLQIRECSSRRKETNTTLIMGAVFAGLARRAQRKKSEGAQDTFLVTSIREMTTILGATISQPEDEPDPKVALPEELRDFADLFDKEKANGLPPYRGEADHHIRLKTGPDGKPPELPWGPLYNMPRDHLLEIRKQVVDLMDKGWIRVSSSSAAAPVLLAKKPGGGWRFCVDYRALNKITKQDRYPLPLVKETLRSLAGAKWLTKLDVRAAFHRIRIAEGDEHLTAFRTRFGLFEWLVCPFGLAGAPATFQRYINNALGPTLGDYVTAYLDDVLVYSGGSRKDHMRKVREVLRRLRDAGLNLDLKKCAFAVKEVKYLGYIVEAGVCVRPDPEKIKAIREWEAPRRVRGVRSFLGFANFYRDFIPNFSEKAAPLTRLTRKNVPFRWGKEEQEAFDALKATFISEPILAQWDPERETIVEADCSGTALGGCLSQRGEDGVLYPVAYHSAKLSPAERNYTIHDKELLAIISCLKAWSAELRSVAAPFTILTDHKNLEYFSQPRPISERQARWAETLSLFNFELKYRPGSQASRPDALSRREQDEPEDSQRVAQLLPPIKVYQTSVQKEARLPAGETLFEDKQLAALWDEGVVGDEHYAHRLQAVRDGARKFPKEANAAQTQIADCSLNAQGALLFRGRLWLPTWEPLTTTITQRIHDSTMSGHPGRNGLFKMLQRDYHWDLMSSDAKRFVRNCNQCRQSKISRQLRQGLLQPLPVPDRFWKQISIDFMIDLPARNKEAPRYLMVITDRLSKYVQLEAMHSMGAEECALRFRDVWWRFHGFPTQIITDRGSDWLSRFWTALCKAVGVEQLLSTSHHPQTDGGTERVNQEVQAILRIFVSFAQYDWPEHLPACQFALNNRDSSVTGVSPNYLLHGFDMSPIQLITIPTAPAASPEGRAARFLRHLKEGMEWTQAAIAYAQQRQQANANRSRRPAERFKVGDEVWLSLRNIKTNRPSKKLDWLNAKYTVVAVPTPLTVTLDVPRGLHPTFHVDLVERAASDPLPSQKVTDERPDPVMVMSEEGVPQQEHRVEAILKARNARGKGKNRDVYVKWVGHDKPTWEPLENFLDTVALDEFEREWGDVRYNDGPVSNRKRAGKRNVRIQTTPQELPTQTNATTRARGNHDTPKSGHPPKSRQNATAHKRTTRRTSGTDYSGSMTDPTSGRSSSSSSNGYAGGAGTRGAGTGARGVRGGGGTRA